MRRYSGPWWASLLLSSAVTGGGSFALLTLLAGLPVETAILISVALIVLGDIVLAFIMESISPTHVMLAPGERRHRNDIAEEFGTVIGDFVEEVREDRYVVRYRPGHGVRPLEPGELQQLDLDHGVRFAG